MGAILADHEARFEWARQTPAFLRASVVLALVAGAIGIVRRRRGAGWIRTPAGAAAMTGMTALFAAVVVGSWPVQPDPYVVCGPVLHRWEESPLCIDELAPFRRALVTLGVAACTMLVVGIVLDRRQSASPPPPGTSR